MTQIVVYSNEENPPKVKADRQPTIYGGEVISLDIGDDNLRIYDMAVVRRIADELMDALDVSDCKPSVCELCSEQGDDTPGVTLEDDGEKQAWVCEEHSEQLRQASREAQADWENDQRG